MLAVTASFAIGWMAFMPSGGFEMPVRRQTLTIVKDGYTNLCTRSDGVAVPYHAASLEVIANVGQRVRYLSCDYVELDDSNAYGGTENSSLSLILAVNGQMKEGDKENIPSFTIDRTGLYRIQAWTAVRSSSDYSFVKGTSLTDFFISFTKEGADESVSKAFYYDDYRARAYETGILDESTVLEADAVWSFLSNDFADWAYGCGVSSLIGQDEAARAFKDGYSGTSDYSRTVSFPGSAKKATFSFLHAKAGESGKISLKEGLPEDCAVFAMVGKDASTGLNSFRYTLTDPRELVECTGQAYFTRKAPDLNSLYAEDASSCASIYADAKGTDRLQASLLSSRLSAGAPSFIGYVRLSDFIDIPSGASMDGSSLQDTFLPLIGVNSDSFNDSIDSRSFELEIPDTSCSSAGIHCVSHNSFFSSDDLCRRMRIGFRIKAGDKRYTSYLCRNFVSISQTSPFALLFSDAGGSKHFRNAPGKYDQLFQVTFAMIYPNDTVTGSSPAKTVSGICSFSVSDIEAPSITVPSTVQKLKSVTPKTIWNVIKVYDDSGEFTSSDTLVTQLSQPEDDISSKYTPGRKEILFWLVGTSVGEDITVVAKDAAGNASAKTFSMEETSDQSWWEKNMNPWLYGIKKGMGGK